MDINTQHHITSLAQLTELYDQPSERVLLKQLDQLDAYCRTIIAASPFLILATCGPTGLDCSPRGDFPGFVEVADNKTLLLPDRRGNNRLDSLKNIVQNPVVGLIFLIPGLHETFRVNGRAQISTDPELLSHFEIDGKRPRTVLVITVEEAFMQCARALLRSDLWNPEKHISRTDLPSIGTIMAAHTKGNVDAQQYDEQIRPLMPGTLY